MIKPKNSSSNGTFYSRKKGLEGKVLITFRKTCIRLRLGKALVHLKYELEGMVSSIPFQLLTPH